MRLFAALELPEEVIACLQNQVELGRAVAPELRWVEPAQWHITLAFYGDVPDSSVDDLSARLVRAVSRVPAFTASIGEPGRFGSTRRARVVWVGLDQGREQVSRLAAGARAAGRRAGLAHDDLAADARFRAHVTLARLAPPGPVEEVMEALAQGHHPTWRASEAVLVRSDLGAGEGGRARHSVLARAALGPQSGGAG